MLIKNCNLGFGLLVLMLLAAVALFGCQSVPVTACPALIQYDQVYRDRLAEEVDQLSAGAALSRAVADYAGLRAAVRACGG